MSRTVLFVDDEERLLQAIDRKLRNDFDIETVTNATDALARMHKQKYAVIVSDMRMPEMNGIELLQHAMRRWPETVRVMLTGNNDLKTATDALKHGQIFQYLTKPTKVENVADTLRQAIKQYELIVAEKELLEKTLRGAVSVLADVLSFANPEAFGKSQRIKRLCVKLANQLMLPDVWQIEMAAMLSHLGCVVLGDGVIDKVMNSAELSKEERQLFDQHAYFGADLLEKIPRLERVANMIRYQGKNLSLINQQDGIPTEVAWGARLIGFANLYDDLNAKGVPAEELIEELKKYISVDEDGLMDAFITMLELKSPSRTQALAVAQLNDNMMLAEDIRSSTGALILCKGQQTTYPIRAKLQNFVKDKVIEDSVKIEMTI